MKRWQAMWLVAMREVRERTRSRTFKIGTAVTVLIVCGAIVAPAIFSDDDIPRYDVGLVQPVAPELERSIRQTETVLGIEIDTQGYADRGLGEADLRSDTIDLLVVPDKELVTKVAIDGTITSDLARVVASVSDLVRLYNGLERQGLTSEQASAALESPPLPLRGLEPAPRRDSENATGASGALIILFVFLTLYGAWILNGVVEEKTSRVVEVLLSTVKADELLIGKVVGIGLVGSIQGVLLVVATFAARASTGSSEAELSPEVLVYAFIWFVLGFAIYAWAYACAGALVSRAEDAQNLVFPLQMPLVASYIVGLVSAMSGPNTASTVMSMIPFTAPMTMLVRMSAGEAPIWQIAISMALCVLTAYVVMRLAITIFSGGILRSGQRVKLREAWRNATG